MPISIDTIVAIATAILGWTIGYITSLNVNSRNRKKELITRYLIEAYTLLTSEANRGKLTSAIEEAITRVQLFGTKKQILLAKDISYQLANENIAGLDALIFDLRDHLRKELNLDQVSLPITYLRITNNDDLREKRVCK